MLRFQFLSERCKDPGGEPFKRVGQIVEQVPPVSYLEGFGRAAPGSAFRASQRPRPSAGSGRLK